MSSSPKPIAPYPRPIDAGVSIGHVHLKVADLNRAIAFYCGVLGFDLMQRYGHEAAFLSAGGYHHHIALPLSASAIAVLEELPRFDRGDYLFSTTFGAGSAMPEQN